MSDVKMTRKERVKMLHQRYLAGELVVNSQRLARKMIEYERAFRTGLYERTHKKNQ